MDAGEKTLIVQGIAQEIVTAAELSTLFEQDDSPIAYDGFEPSGTAHLPIGLYRPLLLKQLLRTGIRFKLLLADSFAWINDKLSGDLQKIELVGEYFQEVWKSAGVPVANKPVAGKVCFVSHYDEFVSDKDYWRKVFQVARHHSEARTKRALTIAGRKEDELRQTAQLFYPSMQAADIFHLADDPASEPIIAQLGLDQRKANMLARDVAEKIGFKKPVAVHHRMLLGLDGVASASAAVEAHEAEKWDEHAMEFKMSKSKPQTCIFVHDSPEEIVAKIAKAYCPPKVVEGNPVLEYCREIVFRARDEVKIDRPKKFGGEIVFASYADLEKVFADGKLHPQDLKNAVASELNTLIAPIRKHFESGSGKKLYEQLKGFEVTR